MSELGSSEGKPNLTPILDMVFQLITFFMLVINFKTNAIDQSLKLPVVGTARPVESQGQTALLVLNIDKDGNLKVGGETKSPADIIAREAFVAMMQARMTQADLDAGKELPTTVVLRGDGNAQTHFIYRVMQECQKRGFRQFALRAMNKEG
jgi:biopolymer transport protein ExbD